MAVSVSRNPSPLRLRTALELLNVDDLKQRLALVAPGQKLLRKPDLMAAIESHLKDAALASLWAHLDEAQRLAVAETLYAADGAYHAERFVAKYGVAPVFGTKPDRYSRETPSLLQLLLYRDGRHGLALTVPVDLAARLRAWVPPPAPAGLSTLDHWPGNEAAWRRDTERDALSEVGIVLRLIDLGKLAVSEKTALPGTACLRELTAALSAGDFYTLGHKDSKSPNEIGPIKAYAWPLLMLAGGLAELHGKKLALTKAGRAALGNPAAKVLRTLWRRWIANKKFDEFNRIDVIRGQTGKGKHSLTAPPGRREIIVRGLSECPAGAWIRLADFTRYLWAAGYRFETTRNPWDLYIHDPHYGSLGYDGFHGWNILQELYLTALLFEYAATLGIIDMAYVEPWKEPQEFGDLWGTDAMHFLSRYDGTGPANRCRCPDEGPLSTGRPEAPRGEGRCGRSIPEGGQRSRVRDAKELRKPIGYIKSAWMGVR